MSKSAIADLKHRSKRATTLQITLVPESKYSRITSFVTSFVPWGAWHLVLQAEERILKAIRNAYTLERCRSKIDNLKSKI
jgi:hypothetical protein